MFSYTSYTEFTHLHAQPKGFCRFSSSVHHLLFIIHIHIFPNWDRLRRETPLNSGGDNPKVGGRASTTAEKTQKGKN